MEGKRTAIMVTNHLKRPFLQAPEKKYFPAENVSVSQAWKRFNATDNTSLCLLFLRLCPTIRISNKVWNNERR